MQCVSMRVAGLLMNSEWRTQRSVLISAERAFRIIYAYIRSGTF